MDILQQLVENSLLTEDTKNAIVEAIEQRIVEAKQEVELEVRTQLTEQFVQERDALVTALDAKMGDLLTAELNELKESISEFRDLEVESAQKLVEAKRELAEQLDKDLSSLVLIVESFLDDVLAAEFAELRESIDEARKNVLGAKIFEAFREQIISVDNPTHELAEKVNATQAKLDKALKELNESKQVAASALRSATMASLTASLTGSKKEVMESLLASVPTEMLQEKYNAYVARLVEHVEEATVVTESTTEQPNLVTVTGDVEQIVENAQPRVSSGLSTNEIERLRALAGIATK